MVFITISENSQGNKGMGCTIAFSVGPFERYYAIFSYYCKKQWNGLFLYMMRGNIILNVQLLIYSWKCLYTFSSYMSYLFLISHVLLHKLYSWSRFRYSNSSLLTTEDLVWHSYTNTNFMITSHNDFDLRLRNFTLQVFV